MNTLKKFSVLLILAVVFTACKKETPEIKTVEVATSEVTQISSDEDIAYAKATFNIEGMTCAMGCAKTIEKRLAKMEGVKSAKVDFDEEMAMVEFDENKLNTNNIEQAVSKVSEVYSVHNMQTVDTFEAKGDEKAVCNKKDCNKPCCADKTTEAKKCDADCNKACCA